MPPASPAPVPKITVLVHRPGRLIALAVAAMLVVTGGLLLALQWGHGFGRGWLNLLLMVPAVAGFVAIMRTGTTRCEVEWSAEQLVVRSLDSSQLLGRTREAVYAWSDVVATAWVGEDGDELRLNFARAPRALVFSGLKRDLDALAAAAGGPKQPHFGNTSSGT
jgi:hypothetical protein